MMNPVGQVQEILAAMLREEPWFADRVSIIEQNKADLRFLLEKQVGALHNVAMVIGCDGMTNHQTGLEMEITVTAIEYVPLNRAKEGFVTAIEAVEAAVDCIDGEWWHFDSMRHETPAERVLQATATFRGMVNRVPDEGEQEER